MAWNEVSLMDKDVRFVTLAHIQSFASLCQDFGISRKTGYKWVVRKRESGFPGLKDMSRRPLGNKASIGAGIVKLIIALKRKHRI